MIYSCTNFSSRRPSSAIQSVIEHVYYSYQNTVINIYQYHIQIIPCMCISCLLSFFNNHLYIHCNRLTVQFTCVYNNNKFANKHKLTKLYTVVMYSQNTITATISQETKMEDYS